MKNQVMLVLILVVLVSLVIHAVPLVKADTTIYIRPDGSIVGTNLITRNGDTYTFTANITAPIHIEKNNIILDCAYYALEGTRLGDAINITASYVTVKNVCILDWSTGILGAYKDNTLTGNTIVGCNFGVKIYDDQYMITNNTIKQCNEGVHLSSGYCTISKNDFTDNTCAIKIYGNILDRQNLITENNIVNNHQAFENGPGTIQKIYYNNFIDNTYPNNEYTQYKYSLGAVQMSTFYWDNGTIGNYYNNYNETDSNGDGIGDTPYMTIDNSTDRYPLMNPIPYAGVTTPEPIPAPTQTSAETSTPAATYTSMAAPI